MRSSPFQRKLAGVVESMETEKPSSAADSVAETLLSCPQPEDETFKKDHVRATCSYEDLSRLFRVPAERKFGVQYSHIYFCRLQRMRERLVTAARRKWGQSFNTQPALFYALLRPFVIRSSRRRRGRERAEGAEDGREMLCDWNAVQEDGPSTKHPQGNQRRGVSSIQ